MSENIQSKNTQFAAATLLLALFVGASMFVMGPGGDTMQYATTLLPAVFLAGLFIGIGGKALTTA